MFSFSAGLNGLFYTGSIKQLSIQALGVVIVGIYTAVMMIIVFLGLKGTHGLLNSYADFVPTEPFVAVTGEVPVAEAVEVKRMPTFDTQSPKFTKIEIIFKEEKLYVLKEAMNKLGITGMTVSQTNMSS